MPLLSVIKKQPEKEYILSNYEKLALSLIPEEQLRSTNHDEHLIDLMIADEARDASPEKTKRDIYKGLSQGDLSRVLAASKNLSPQERKRIVDGLYNYLLSKKELDLDDTKKLMILSQDKDISLEEFCIKLSTLKVKM
jgi:hypothetical protein